MRFWDASALIPLLVDQEGTAPMRDLLAEDPELVVWWGTPIECLSALARIARETEDGWERLRQTEALLEELAAGGIEIEPTDRIRAVALRLLRTHPLRAADALQLAAALAWREERPTGAELVTLDERLAAAARIEGFTVLPA